MSTIRLYSKIEMLPEHLQQRVLEYIEYLLSRQAKLDETQPSPENSKTPKSRFAGRISSATAKRLHQQLQEMREEWP